MSPQNNNVRDAFDLRFEKIAKWLIARGVKPNQVTLLQLPVLAAMVWAGIELRGGWFFGLSWLIMALDGLDGIIARVAGIQSRAGAILDAAFDTVGILIVLWGAAQFHPDQTWAWLILFILTAVLYLQNIILHNKVVGYVRGPVLLTIPFPNILWLAIIGTVATSAWLVLVRMPRALTSTPEAKPSP